MRPIEVILGASRMLDLLVFADFSETRVSFLDDVAGTWCRLAEVCAMLSSRLDRDGHERDSNSLRAVVSMSFDGESERPRETVERPSPTRSARGPRRKSWGTSRSERSSRAPRWSSIDTLLEGTQRGTERHSAMRSRDLGGHSFAIIDERR